MGVLVLQLQDCSFSYRRGQSVLKEISAEFAPGRTVLLGPNGAGKSTLLSVLASVLRPASGAVLLNQLNSARPADRHEYRRRVAWLPQLLRPFPGLTVQEHVAYSGWLKGMSRSDAWARSTSALEQVDLASSAEKSATQLSGGQMRRLGLAGALVHDAEVLLLDEPTAGLDPAQRKRFAGILASVDPTKTVVVSTHQTEDVHDSYDTVMLLVSGQVPFVGTVDEFVKNESGSDARDRVAGAYSSYIVEED